MHYSEITAASPRPGNSLVAVAWAVAIGWQFASFWPGTLAVKLLSVLCTLMLTASVWQLLKATNVAHAARWALLVPVLPSVMFSGAIPGQDNALYVAPCVMAVAAALERRHRSMFAWYGLAMAIKAQALVGAPFMLAIVIARQVPVRHWLYAPAAFALALAAAALGGWPIADWLTMDAPQSPWLDDIARNAPNIWMVAQLVGITTPLVGLAAAAAVGATACYAAQIGATARSFSRPMLLRAALLAPLLLAGLLPQMHGRCFFIADILSLALVSATPSRETVRLLVQIQLGSMLALGASLFALPWLAALGAIPMISATILVARPLLWRSANDNPLRMRVA